MSERIRRIYDITMPLGACTPTWPGDPEISVRPVLTVEQDGAQVSRLALGTHSGTHIDAPAHLFAGGKDVSRLDPAVLMGPAEVIYLAEARAVTVADLVSSVSAASYNVTGQPLRLLLKTSNSDRGLLAQDFAPDYVALTTDAAEWLVARGTVLIGIDALSVDPFSDALCSVHRILLAHDVVVVEGLDLRQVEPGLYHLVCLPLRIPGGDGAPARALLVERPPDDDRALSGT